MNDKTDNLSALMDGELHGQQDQDKCVEQLANDKEMQDVWQSYHLARDAMKGQLSAFAELDISAKMFRRNDIRGMKSDKGPGVVVHIGSGIVKDKAIKSLTFSLSQLTIFVRTSAVTVIRW